MTLEHLPDNTLITIAKSPSNGNGASIEMMRRLKDVIIQQDKSTQKLNSALLLFTIATFAVAILQLITAIIQICKR